MGQPKGSKELKLIQKYHDKEETKLWQEYHVDQFGKWQGEYKYWYENGQIGSISNYKGVNWHGKYQHWWVDGTRNSIDTNHHKKREHGTKIKFKYEYSN